MAIWWQPDGPRQRAAEWVIGDQGQGRRDVKASLMPSQRSGPEQFVVGRHVPGSTQVTPAKTNRLPQIVSRRLNRSAT